MKLLDCHPYHYGVHDEYPHGITEEFWILFSPQETHGRMSKLYRAELDFLYYFYSYEKYGNLEWRAFASIICSSMERAKNSYGEYLDYRGLDKPYYREVMGI